MASPVLPTNHTCTIALTYAPGSVGTSQATLYITENAAGSPQFVTLSGTAVIPAPGAPGVTLNPSGTLQFPGTPTQGTSTSPQTVTLTNSGGATL
jgi:trimeric autotransporter adhesin